MNDLLLDRFPGQPEVVQTIVTELGDIEIEARLQALGPLVVKHTGMPDTTLLLNDAAIRVKLSDETARLQRLFETGILRPVEAGSIGEALRKAAATAQTADNVPRVADLVRERKLVPAGADIDELALTPSQMETPPDPALRFERYTAREDALLARLAVQMGFIDNDSYRRALDARSRTTQRLVDTRPGLDRTQQAGQAGQASTGTESGTGTGTGKRAFFKDVFFRDGFLTAGQILELFSAVDFFQEMKRDYLMARQGIQLEVLQQDAVMTCLRVQQFQFYHLHKTGPDNRLGTLLVRLGFNRPDELARLLELTGQHARSSAAIRSSAELKAPSGRGARRSGVGIGGVGPGARSSSGSGSGSGTGVDLTAISSRARQAASELDLELDTSDDGLGSDEYAAPPGPGKAASAERELPAAFSDLPDLRDEDDTDKGDLADQFISSGGTVRPQLPSHLLLSEEGADDADPRDFPADAQPASAATPPVSTPKKPGTADPLQAWQPPERDLDDTAGRLAGRRRLLEELKGSAAFAMHFGTIDKESRVLVQLLVLFENLPIVRLASAAREYRGMADYGVSVRFADVLANLNLLPADRLDAVLRYRERAVITCENDSCDKMLTRRERTDDVTTCPDCGSPFRTTPEPASTSGVFDPAATGRFLSLDDDADDDAQPSWFGRFRLNEVTDDGQVFIRFEGFDPETGEACSIKLFHDPYREFVRQKLESLFARLCKLRHPALETVYEYGELDDEPFLRMPSSDGIAMLDALLLARGTLPVGEMVGAMAEICDGLARAARAKVFHLDVRPARIARKRGGRGYQLRDFELARVRGRGPGVVSETVFGEPAYLAPELTIKGVKPTAAVDVYGVGMTLYETLTGVLPFTDTDPRRLLNAIRTTAPEKPQQLNPDIPPALGKLILQCL
ncbi:MAG: serine/threonine-protein kinase, partial [Planctomycetota bacterium]